MALPENFCIRNSPRAKELLFALGYALFRDDKNADGSPIYTSTWLIINPYHPWLLQSALPRATCPRLLVSDLEKALPQSKYVKAIRLANILQRS